VDGSPEGLRALAAALARATACGSADAAWEQLGASGAAWSADGPVYVQGPLFVRCGVDAGVAAAALERQRLRAEADAALAAVRPRLVEAEAAREAAEVALVSARDALSQRQEARAKALEAVREAEAEAKAAAREREELDRQLRRAEAARAAAGVELAEATRATAVLGGSRAALRQRIAEEEEQSSRAEEALTAEQALLADDARGLGRSRETLQARATEAAALRERLLGLQRAVKDADDAIETAERLSARCAEEEASARTRLAEIATETTDAAAALEALQDELARLLSRLDAERERAQAERAALAAAEDALRAQRVKKDAATAKRAEVDRRLQAVRAEIGHLTEDLEGRYAVGVAGLLDRIDRFGHIVLDVDPGVRVEDLPEAARPGRKDEELMDDVRVTVGVLEDAAALDGWRQRVDACRAGLAALGDVNLAALAEYAEVREAWRELDAQRADLQSSVTDLEQTIGRLNRLSRERFRETFERVDAAFRALYPRLVGGGEARLALTDEEDMLETGVDIFVQPPGKRLQAISLLSGGEMAMVAIALIFALFQVKPSPFCLLDEVDAPLDETNGARFNVMLREMAQLSQFIVVTHNRKTMEAVDTLYGVTMLTPGVSTLVSVQLH
jgi:chromosome segregation protein